MDKSIRKITTKMLLIAVIVILSIGLGSSVKQEELTPPRITSPIYDGAQIVEVSGFEANAEVRVLVNGIDKGGGRSWFGRGAFRVDKLSKGQEIRAIQIVDGVSSFPTREEYKVIVEEIPQKYRDIKYTYERLLPPEIDEPLCDCMSLVPIKNVVPGSLVQVFSPPDISNPVGRGETPWNYARIGTPLLTKDQIVKADQMLLYSKPSDLSPDKSVVAKPSKLKPPVIDENDLVVGHDTIGIDNLWIGAKVDIYYENNGQRESIGGGIAAWPGTIFHVKPLKAEWVDCQKCIKADQSLCDDLKSTSEGKTLKNSLDPITILEPVCQGSSEVTVCGTPSNAPLQIFLKGQPDQAIASLSSTGFCTPVVVGGPGGVYLLHDEDEIYARETIGNLKVDSITVRVGENKGPIFEIRNGKFCQSCNGENGPIFARDSQTKMINAVFRVAMCGAEAAQVEIWGSQLIETIKLDPIKTKIGYFEGKSSKVDIPSGKYNAKFKISGGGPAIEQEEYFYVNSKDCLEYEVLCAQNKYRAEVNIPPLVWSDALAEGAEECADRNADKWNGVQTVHCQDTLGGGQGESIGPAYYAGTKSIDQFVKSWGDEKEDWEKETGLYQHYDNMISYSKCGCGMATNGDRDFLVCRYE